MNEIRLCFSLLLAFGVGLGLFFAGAHVYGRAAYDAYGEDNLDKRPLAAGLLIGLSLAWFSHTNDLIQWVQTLTAS